MSGFVGDLSPEQEQTLQEVKNRLADKLAEDSEYDDHFVLRFCRARKFDVENTTQMLEAALDWRKSYNVKEKVDEVKNSAKFEFLRSYYPVVIFGEDREGHPVVIERLGQVDPKGMLSKATNDELVQFHVYMHEMLAEKCREQSEKHGKKIQTVVNISDLSGLGWQHLYKPGLAVIKLFVGIDEGYFPETMHRLYIINTPKVFNVIWKIVKSWMDEITLQKIQILGYDYHDALTAAIDPSNIPKEYGGHAHLKSGPGGMPSAGPVAGYGDANAPSVVTVSKKHEVKIEVTEPGTHVNWEFSTQAHDVAFAITYTGPGTPDEIEPNVRYDCHTEPAQGSFVAKEAGTYTFLFDNSFSMLRKKTVTYHITQTAPGATDMVDESTVDV